MMVMALLGLLSAVARERVRADHSAWRRWDAIHTTGLGPSLLLLALQRLTRTASLLQSANQLG
jgi:hypothetical protein